MLNFALVIELARHIEILLLSNNCVIIPDLGGFMTHHVDARYDREDALFLPPLRTLGFNPQIKLNDSLLAQSYVEAYDISYPEALRKIEAEVKELKDTLNNYGTYELADIGTLYLNDDSNISFAPCEVGILSPELYGLSSFDMPLLGTPAARKEKKEKKEEKSKTTEKEENTAEVVSLGDVIGDEEEQDKTVEIKIAWIRNIVAVAAAVIAFFVFSTPIANTHTDQQAATVHLQLPNTVHNAPTITSKAVHESVSVTNHTTATGTTKSETVVTEAGRPVTGVQEKSNEQAKVSKPYYTIVLASQVALANAKVFVEQLHHEGLEDASININNKVVRVVYGSFDNEADAYNELRAMRANNYFEEAWVYKVKPITQEL